MRLTNKKIINYLLKKEKFDVICSFPHNMKRRSGGMWHYYKNKEPERLQDLFGVFDAIGIKNGEAYFLQFKTNSWGEISKYKEFAKKNKHIKFLLIRYNTEENEIIIRDLNKEIK